MRRFVILEHDAGAIHWDFLLDTADDAPLMTWRLAANPLVGPSPIAATRLPDHRRRYLDYEGPLSGDRGSVRRVEQGAAVLLLISEALVRLRLRGERLAGIARIDADGWRFEAEPAG